MGIQRLFPRSTLRSVLIKTMLGQILFGPLFIIVYFAASLVAEGGLLRLGRLPAKISADLVQTVVAGLWFWQDIGWAALFAVIGHCFPVWLGFKGGKGVATYIGVLLGIAPAAVLIFAFVWLLVARLSRYSSLSALVATLVMPVALWIMDQPQASLVMAVLTIISWWRHKANIERLISGSESRIGDKG